MKRGHLWPSSWIQHTKLRRKCLAHAFVYLFVFLFTFFPSAHGSLVPPKVTAVHVTVSLGGLLTLPLMASSSKVARQHSEIKKENQKNKKTSLPWHSRTTFQSLTFRKQKLSISTVLRGETWFYTKRFLALNS